MQGTVEAPKPEAQVAIDELAAQAGSPEEQATLQEWQAELDAERQEALAGIDQNRELVALPNGAVADSQEVQASRERGEESPISTTAGRTA